MKHASPTPKAAVLAWWQAMQEHDLATLQDITASDYISAGGPGARIVGRDAFLGEVRAFLSAGSIQHWSVDDLLIRTNGDVAVCSYLWHERGTHDGRSFEMSGIATDVLVRTAGRWHHQAHHTSTGSIAQESETSG